LWNIAAEIQCAARPHLAEADRDAPGFAYSLGTSGTNNPYGSRS